MAATVTGADQVVGVGVGGGPRPKNGNSFTQRRRQGDGDAVSRRCDTGRGLVAIASIRCCLSRHQRVLVRPRRQMRQCRLRSQGALAEHGADSV
jgi:hypothetical protein